MYFNIFMPFLVGRSTSASMISIYCPSAFNASITCLADFTDVTVKHEKSIVYTLYIFSEYLRNWRSIKSYKPDCIHTRNREHLMKSLHAKVFSFMEVEKEGRWNSTGENIAQVHTSWL
jgi:hypothetical protein